MEPDEGVVAAGVAVVDEPPVDPDELELLEPLDPLEDPLDSPDAFGFVDE